MMDKGHDRQTHQTGPNNQFGGVHVGFLIRLYQPLIAGMVEMLPMKPAPSGKARAIIKLTAF